jgi:hypothetical protein
MPNACPEIDKQRTGFRGCNDFRACPSKFTIAIKKSIQEKRPSRTVEEQKKSMTPSLPEEIIALRQFIENRDTARA